jgi:amino acid adenylation domain-containing protein
VTIVPRWTAQPVPGTATYRIPGPVPAAGELRAAYERVVSWLAGDPDATGDPALRVGPDLTLAYDTARFDAGFAVRFGRYLRAALDGAADLLPADEREHLVNGRGGPVRELPDARFHELFARRAAAHPDAVAVRYRAETWTYGRLDRAANQVAHALLDRGLAAEEVVAVATGRTPAWLAAVIGVVKAGGAYLPVEPDHPPARVATLLDQSRCRLVITAPGRREVPGAVALPVDELLTGPDHDPGVPVGPDRLAYLYFTSGSTGLPKGAMCEHAGMVNHLLAKVDDFGLTAADVVVQNAEASFDISLWQLVAPLMVGGHTVIVPREEILDVRRFLDTIVDRGATVLQVVPSYLDILLRETEREPRDVGRLRCVSVTGEAISKPLVSRFFARYPHLRLINAYGATEASDDTTHEVMTAPPEGDLVPVGRPIGNVTGYVLGPGDTLRPLGTVGEIAFSGVCVGRGYINDPARTAEAFGTDPFRPGHRLYRTGDYGRWLPSGTIEFHGRRDEQVKVNGVRIELGEVESRLLEHPRIGAASVIVVPLPGAGKSLVGCYASPDGLDPDELRRHLATVLPANAVPARLYPLDALPLNANGKVDKKALAAAVLAEPVREPATEAPQTDTERRIAAAWARALDRPVERIGRHDHFFDIGGGSLSALRVVASLDGLIALDDLVRTPVLSAVAAAADGVAPVATGGLLRLLAGPEQGAAWALICAPYAAGTAISFQPLAAALAAADPTVATYAVQAPGHDLGRPGEAMLEVEELGKLVVDEAAARLGDTPVALWGHCAGVPLALDCARRLPALRHLFLAARLPEPDAALSRQIAAVVAASPAALADWVAAEGADLAGLGAAERVTVGRAYRHDTRTANEYLLGWDGPPLPGPATVVVGTADPLTAGYAERWAGWQRFATDTTLAEAPGGHLFHREAPGAVAAVILERGGR